MTRGAGAGAQAQGGGVKPFMTVRTRAKPCVYSTITGTRIPFTLLQKCIRFYLLPSPRPLTTVANIVL